jgi:hypothetical protein
MGRLRERSYKWQRILNRIEELAPSLADPFLDCLQGIILRISAQWPAPTSQSDSQRWDPEIQSVIQSRLQPRLGAEVAPSFQSQ